jgi:hypothetical protein
MGESYRVMSAGEFLLAAQSTKQALDISENGRPTRLAAVGRSGNWTLFGPLRLGLKRPDLATDSSVRLGPLVSWSPLTARVLSAPSTAGMAVIERVQSEQIETLKATAGNQWVELRNTFDAGWQLTGASLHITGHGLFNLYFVPMGAGHLIFQFSSHAAEVAGRIATGLWLILIVGLLLLLRTPRPTGSGSEVGPEPTTQPSFLGRTIGLAGYWLVALGIVAYIAGWLAVPSSYPQLVGFLGGSIRLDPYDASTLYIALGMLLLGISILLRLSTVLRASLGGKR